jgi:hypothetical protein
MTARVIPFPSARRVGQVRKTARYVAELNPRQAQAHIQEQVRRLAESLERKGVAPRLITAECAAYEGAIRAALWRLVLHAPGGDAA